MKMSSVLLKPSIYGPVGYHQMSIYVLVLISDTNSLPNTVTSDTILHAHVLDQPATLSVWVARRGEEQG